MKYAEMANKVLTLTLVGGMLLCIKFAWANSSSRAANTDYIVEYSLQGLKDSAQQMANRNAWLVSQMAQIDEQIPALRQRMTILEGQKEKYLLLEGDDLTSRTLKKYAGEDKLSALKGQATLLEEQRMLEEKIQRQEINNQRYKENKMQIEKEISQLQYELSLLKTEVKDSFEKDHWNELVRAKEQSLKRLKNAERSLVQLNGRFSRPDERVRNLEFEQKRLQQRLGELENQLNISFNQDNELRQKILNVRSQYVPQINQLNQDLEQLKSKIKEMEDTITQVRNKISEKKLQLSAPGSTDKDLKRNLELITQENAVLKNEMISLKENLINIESLR